MKNVNVLFHFIADNFMHIFPTSSIFDEEAVGSLRVQRCRLHTGESQYYQEYFLNGLSWDVKCRCICVVAVLKLHLNPPAVGLSRPKSVKSRGTSAVLCPGQDAVWETPPESQPAAQATGELQLPTSPDTHLWWCVSELKEEVVYYDVCEDAEELHSLAHAGPHQSESAAVRQLQRRLQTLETKRGSICARRAYLRNKKVGGGVKLGGRGWCLEGGGGDRKEEVEVIEIEGRWWRWEGGAGDRKDLEVVKVIDRRKLV